MKVNGSLVFDASSASEIQNLRVEKVATNPAHNQGSDRGRLIFNTTDGKLYQGSATAWVAIATGGDASALQNAVDAIETTLGAIVNSSGVFQVGAVTGPAFSGSEADLTEVIQALSDYANSNNELSELDDVTLTSAADNDLLQYNSTSSKWENKAIGSASGVQAWDAGLDALAALSGTGIVVETADGVFTNRSLTAPAAGITITNPDGVAGSPTFALANDLAALEGLSANGLIARTGDGTAAVRTITGPSAGITVTNGDGVSGDPTLALANDLAALEGLTTTGYIVRTGDGTATTRSMAVVSGDLVITGAADGVSTDTTFGLASVTQAATGDFVKITLDSKGRVTGNTAVTTADITALVDSTYVNVSGDTMTGNLNMGSSFKVTGLATPTADTDAATKAYVDATAAGLTWKNAVNVMATSNVALSGSTPLTIDGHAIDDTDSGYRVLLTGQTTDSENGIYVVTAGSGAYTLARGTDTDTYQELIGASVFVLEGTAYANSGWVQSNHYLTDFTAQDWVQFSGSSTYTWGTGLVASGNTINIQLGAGIAELPSDEVGLDVAAGKAVQLTSSLTGGQLTFVLDTGSGLEQSSSGLKISAAGVTNAMLVNDSVTVNGDTGTGDLALGGTLEVKGDSVQGIVTSVNGTGTFTVTATTATSSQLGVAKFNTGDFDVTAGDVTIKTGGVDNAQLVNSTVTITGTTGSDAVALGESLAIIGDSAAISTAMGTNSLAISARLASTTVTGVASFAAADFAVSVGGEVTVGAKSLDWLTDVTITSAVGGETLVNNGSGQFVNRKVYHLHDQSSAATSWTVSHSLGQKYCNVTVVDASDEVVIPQSITFDSANQLTVTFNTAIAGKVVVMGIA